jgi:thiol-disulfide isomerase/thioredoxin
MKIIIGLLAMLLPILSAAQSPPVKALSIGDTVPDVVLNEMTNYKTNSAKLSDFKANLLLLDFWGTWCSSCLQSFPKMDSLKTVFKSVQVLLVNTKSKISKDNEKKIQNTLKRLTERTGNNIRLPVVYNNDMLDALFPLKYIPQVIWISKNRVIAITGSEEVTGENISTVLNGGIINVHTKKDLLSYDENIPLFENGNGGKPRQKLFRSMITGYI